MSHVLWLGGPPGSGKTTIATRLARRHGLRLYRADTRTWIHRDRAIAAGNPAAGRWEALAPDARWVLPTDELLELSLHRERAAMVVDDLRALPAAPAVVAEGSSLPAAAVPDPSRAVWLLPSSEFQAAQLASRPMLDGRRRLYLRLRQVTEVEARERGVPTLVLDGTLSIEGAVTAVESAFAGALGTGAGATTVTERQGLLREANEAVVEQVRGYFARPWADGDAEAVVQLFLCECGAPACEAEVEATVGAAAAGPLRAEHPHRR